MAYVTHREQYLVRLQILVVPPLLVVREYRQGTPLILTDGKIIDVNDECGVREVQTPRGLHCRLDAREPPVVVFPAQPVHTDRAVPDDDQSGVPFAELMAWDLLVEHLQQHGRQHAWNSFQQCG
jgi:hypothetical protein